jgi:cytochrome c peroxidase
MIKNYITCITLAAFCLFVACSKKDPEPPQPGGESIDSPYKPTPYIISYPKGFPTMKIPANNPMTVEGVALGKKLFYDNLLSADNTIACASCHKQEYSFDDNKKFSEGVNGQLGVRNAMPLFNLGWAEMFNPTSHRFFWDGGASDLENQVIGPIQNPVEMNQDLKELEKELRAHPEYPQLFKKAFGIDSITIKYVMYAIAQFERTLISGNSKFDKYKRGEEQLTEQEFRGLDIFLVDTKGEGGGCFHCHGNDISPFFTNFRFHNNGLDSIPTDLGLGKITGDPNDNGLFKVPSLRNLAFTAPYMHDGRFSTLEEVVEFYNSGVKNGPTTDANLRMHVQQGGLGLSEQEKQDLIAFLKTLNDYDFLTNPKFK